MSHTAVRLLLTVAMAMGSILVVSPPASANNACTQSRARPIVWYDSDQYGTWPKIQGRLLNCDGPKSVRVLVNCEGKGIVANLTAKSDYEYDSTIYTPVAYIGYCGKGKRWTASVTVIFSGVIKRVYSFNWYDGGYPS